MIDKLKLKFCLSSDLETPEIEEAAARYFDNERQTLLNNIIEGLNERHIHQHSPKTFNFKDWAQKYIECSVILHPAFELRAKKELATLAQRRLSNLVEVLDLEEAELLSMEAEIEPKTKTFLVKRIARLLATLSNWEENLSNGDFEVWQTRPYEKMPEHFERFPNFRDQYKPNNTGGFPAKSFRIPWNPAAAKVKQEPEEFRQIWLNPEEDIPFVLEALKRLEFIDENEVWRWNTGEDNPRGVIDAIILKTNFFSDFSGEHRTRVFAQRFKFPNIEKRFERKGKPYDRAKTKMTNYLKP